MEASCLRNLQCVLRAGPLAPYDLALSAFRSDLLVTSGAMKRLLDGLTTLPAVAMDSGNWLEGYHGSVVGTRVVRADRRHPYGAF